MYTPGRLTALIERGVVPVGMQCFTGSHALIEVMGRTGFDFVWLDSEHTSLNPRALEDTIRVADAAGLIPLVRIPEPDDSTSARRALEAGADGVVVPMVRTADDVEWLIGALTYPPGGTRGICPAYRAADYSAVGFAAYARAADEALLIIPMIETLDALDNIEEIFANEHVRLACFAAGELAFAFGGGANADMHASSSVEDAYVRVRAAAERNGVALIGGNILDPTPENCARAIEDGIRVFCLGLDVMTFRRACETAIAAANAGVDGAFGLSRPVAPPSGLPPRQELQETTKGHN